MNAWQLQFQKLFVLGRLLERAYAECSDKAVSSMPEKAIANAIIREATCLGPSPHSRS